MLFTYPQQLVRRLRAPLLRHRSYWLQLFIATGVLLLCLVLPIGLPEDLQMLLLLLAPGAAFTLFCLKWPTLGLVTLIGTIVIPFNGPSGFNLTMALVALLLGLWLLDMLLYRRKIMFVRSGPMLPLVLFLVICVVAFGQGQLPWYRAGEHASLGAQLGGLTIILLSAGAFLLVANQIHEIVWLEWLTWLLLSLIAIYVIGLLVPGLKAYVSYFFRPGIAAGSLFWTWGAVLAFSQAAFNTKLRPRWRVVLSLLTLAILIVAFVRLRTWSSGWVPAFVALGSTLWIAKPTWRLGLLAGGAGVGLLKFQSIMNIVMVGDNVYSLGTRLDAWSIVWKITMVNPLLGLGMANYNAYTPLFPIRGWAVNFNSHSQYVDVIAQTGLLGLACFVWFLVTVGWLGWRLRTRVPAGFAQAYVYGAWGGLVGTAAAAALGDWVLPFFYNVGMNGFRASVLGWIFLGGLVALEQMQGEQDHGRNHAPLIDANYTKQQGGRWGNKVDQNGTIERYHC